MAGSAFFEGVRQADVVVGGRKGKLPIFYYDWGGFVALLPARLSVLRAWMPDDRVYAPARLTPGVGIVALAAFAHRETDLGSYNEVAVWVPVADPGGGGVNLPGTALARAQLTRKSRFYVHRLPVTTETALLGGLEPYGFPKTLARIELSDDADWWTCRMEDGDSHVLTLAGGRIDTSPGRRLRWTYHLWMDGQAQSCEAVVNPLALGTAVGPSAAAAVSLDLGPDHPISRELDEALLGRRALAYYYVPRGEGILYGPDRMTAVALERLGLARVEAEEPARA